MAEAATPRPVATAAGGGGGVHAVVTSKATRKLNKLLDVTPDRDLMAAIELIDEAYNLASPSVSSSPRDPQQQRAKDAGSSAVEGVKRLPAPTALRGDLDARLLALHVALLKTYGAVDEKFREVSANVDRLAQECAVARGELAELAADSGPLLSTAEVLEAEREELRAREAQIQQFMSRYQLSQAEHDALRGEVTPAFLDALQRVNDIHASCKVMVLPEQQHAAIEIQETMYLTQVAAVEKVARYVSQHLSQAFSPDTPDVPSFLLRAIVALRVNAGAWTKILHDLARIRRTSITRRFLGLLSMGSTGGSSSRGGDASGAFSSGSSSTTAQRAKGIGLKTDMVKLAGDLCAWLHQAAAEDADALAPLFAPTSSMPTADANSAVKNWDGAAAGDGGSAAATASVTKVDLLDQIFEGVCRPLRERLQQAMLDSGCTAAAIAEHYDLPSILTLFKLEALLGFYLATTETLLGTNAALTEALRAQRLDTLRVFYEGLQAAMRRLSSAAFVPSDLGVPGEVQGVLRVLRDMLEHLQSSFVPLAQREGEFAPVLGAVVDPVVALTEKATLPNHVPADQALNGRLVHQVNVLCAVLSTILPFDFAEARQRKITARLEELLLQFTDRNVTLLLEKFGLRERVAELQRTTSTGAEEGAESDKDTAGSPVPARPSLAVFKSNMAGFFTYIYNLEALAVPQLDQVQVLRIRDRLRVDITQQVCRTYDVLYALAEREYGASDAHHVLVHTPSQLRVLLDVPEKSVSA